MAQKIVINTCMGVYGLSEEAYRFLGIPWDKRGYAFEEDRANPILVTCVEILGEQASGDLAELKVVEIPDGVEWIIEEDLGIEWVAEKHRTWK